MRKIVTFLLTIFLLFQVINVCFVKGEAGVASNFQCDERHSGFYPYSIQTTGVPRYKFYVDASIASPLITSNGLIVVASKKNIYITDKQVSKIKVFEKVENFVIYTAISNWWFAHIFKWPDNFKMHFIRWLYRKVEVRNKFKYKYAFDLQRKNLFYNTRWISIFNWHFW